MSQKRTYFIVTAVETSSLTFRKMFPSLVYCAFLHAATLTAARSRFLNTGYSVTYRKSELPNILNRWVTVVLIPFVVKVSRCLETQISLILREILAKES
jgi:hypothetical protein